MNTHRATVGLPPLDARVKNDLPPEGIPRDFTARQAGFLALARRVGWIPDL